MSSDPNQAIERIVDGRTWDAFCDSLKAAGTVVLDAGTPEDAFTRAEGWRYLTRLTRAALETFVEASDAQAPAFRQATGPTIKMGMDNPDNVYLSAPVNGSYEYRISGTRGTVYYLGFGSQAGNYGATGSLDTTGYLESRDMEIEHIGAPSRVAFAVEKTERPVNRHTADQFRPGTRGNLPIDPDVADDTHHCQYQRADASEAEHAA